MPQSLAKNYIHLVFSTKHREPSIDDDISEKLYSYLGSLCKNLECNPIQIGGYYDHVHVLCILSKKIALIKLVEEVKKRSSLWIKQIDPKYAYFYWQDGYSAFSVSPIHIEKVTKYIQNQYIHHQHLGFQDECRKFYDTYQVDYDERYVWD